MQKCGLRSAYQPFYHHKWSSAVQNSLECNSHASFQESFKVNKCMSVPIENCDFLSILLTQVCNVEYHPLTIQTFCHLFMNRNFLCIVMTVSFLFYLFYFSNCRNNKPLFKAGPFDEAFNISDRLDIEKVNLTVLYCI